MFKANYAYTMGLLLTTLLNHAALAATHVTLYPQGDALFYEKKVVTLAPGGVQSIPLSESQQARDFQVFPASGNWPQGVEPLGVYSIPRRSNFWEQWVNKPVQVFDATTGKYVKGTLRSFDKRDNVVLVEVNGSLWRNTLNEVLVRDIPKEAAGMVSPGVRLKVNSQKALALPLDVFHERDGLNARMAYTWRLPADAETTGAVLDANLVVSNDTVDALTDVKLNALFGANRQQPYGHPYAMKVMRMDAMAEAAPMANSAPQSESVGELMMLRLPGAFSLEAGQTVTLPYKTFRLGKEAVQRYIYAPTQHGWWWQSGNETYTAPNQPIEHWLEISDWAEQLPDGAFKAFQPDTQGNLQLIGEGQQPYHVKQEPLRLSLGVAQQIRVNKKQTAYDYNKALKLTTVGYETVLTNTKATPVVVDVYEYPGTEWKLGKHNGTLAQVQGVPVAFRLNLKPGEKRSLTYTFTNRG